jgi:hypothetical protein
MTEISDSSLAGLIISNPMTASMVWELLRLVFGSDILCRASAYRQAALSTMEVPISVAGEFRCRIYRYL